MSKKNILVIGASRGIGKELVEIFASNPEHQVIACARNIAKLKADFDALPNVHVFQFDLESASRKQDLTDGLKDFPTIDFAVNNAGKLVNKPFLELTSADIRGCYEVNVFGIMESTQVLVEKLQTMGGHIVNISSMGGFQGSVKFPGLSAYSSSKAAVASFTEMFAEEFKESKIRMNCLCLGAAQTEMLEEAFPGYQALLSAREMATYIADFTLNGHRYFNGKILPVSLTTP
jgi:3-oxoacyl-[acyl-carrier protein] reductase